MPAIVILVGLAVVWLPGASLTRLLRNAARDPLSRIAHAVALSLSLWPIAFFLSSLAAFRWNTFLCRIALAAMFIAVVLVRRWRPRIRIDAVVLAAAALLGLVVFTRALHIAGIEYPLWVDSVHHTMIIRLILEHGSLPDSYAPFIPESSFYYHWGFHSVAAVVAWVAGIEAPDVLPRLLLIFGQFLNVLIFPAVYLGARELLRRRTAALLAATLATLVSFFPAYYVSWGRYTLLTGLLILPALAVAFWRLKRHPNWRGLIEVAILSAGLLLVHARVAIVFAVLAFLLLLAPPRTKSRQLLWPLGAGLIGVVLVSPWLLHLAAKREVRSLLAPTRAERLRWQITNDVPEDLIWAPNNMPLFVIATGGLIGLTPAPMSLPTRIASVAFWALLIIVLARRRGRLDMWRLGLLAVWVILIGGIVNADRAGLPRLQALTNSSAVIMLFLPVSIAAAHVIQLIVRRKAVLMTLTLLIGIGGAWSMRRIVNPVTVLVTRADVEALRWIRANVPVGARFDVDVQPWIGDSYVGVDGGYWIPVAADRASVLPPGLYPWVMPPGRVDEVTRELESEQPSDVTHSYIGVRNPRRTPPPEATRIYARGGVEIYAFTRPR